MPQDNFPFFLFILSMTLIWVVFYLLTKISNKKEDKNSSLKLIQQQILSLNKLLDYKLSENNKNNITQWQINSNISKEANKKIEEITKKLSSLEETNKQIKDIWWQLSGLENILKNPKQRGILWEYFLENILKNILPPENYSLQYKFKDWTLVDSVIFVKDKIIPIDSKFSLENYNKVLSEEDEEKRENYIKYFKADLKKRIDETAKYIKSSEKTMDFAFMFIPSEWVYYDLLINKIWTLKATTIDLIEYAFKEKKVIIVSPTSFYAYLQTVMQWLRALSIEEKALEIRKSVEKLSKHLSEYEHYLEKVWKNLETTVNSYNSSYKKFNMMEKDILKITENNKDEEIQNLQIEKPKSG